MAHLTDVLSPSGSPKRGRALRADAVQIGARVLIGAVVAGSSMYVGAFRASGLESLGPLVAIALVVFSLFGDLPSWIAWTQRIGSWLLPGIAVATVVLLVPLLTPAGSRESSLVAFSPSVWAAYLSIVLVGVSFGASDLPERIYALCQRLRVGPAVVIPVFVVVAGLLGNILDGVSIIAISVVILLGLLERLWAVRAAFALLFGGLISNLITVAAEPTNIKFGSVDILRQRGSEGARRRR